MLVLKQVQLHILHMISVNSDAATDQGTDK